MTDKEWIAEVKKIEEPVEMLKCLIDNSEFFGYDPYYSDLRKAMLDQARKVVETKKLKKDGDILGNQSEI